MVGDEQILQTIPKCYSYGELLKELGYSPKDGRRRKQLKERLVQLQADTSHFGASRVGSVWHDIEEVQRAARQAKSIGQLLQLLGLKNIGSNHESAKKHIQRLQIDTSHFEQARRRDDALKQAGKKRTIPLQEILEGEHPSYRTDLLKKRLFNAGIKQEQCEECEQGPTWNGKRLTLQLDHIDGNKYNHKLENLRVLCPNCHTQTGTYAGKKQLEGVQTGKAARL